MELLNPFNMDKEFKSWAGNALNFLLVVYLIKTNLITNTFNFKQSMLSVFGLFISILIQLSNVLT